MLFSALVYGVDVVGVVGVAWCGGRVSSQAADCFTHARSLGKTPTYARSRLKQWAVRRHAAYRVDADKHLRVAVSTCQAVEELAVSYCKIFSMTCEGGEVCKIQGMARTRGHGG